MNKLRKFLKEEDGMGVVEVVLIIVEICIYHTAVFVVYTR